MKTLYKQGDLRICKDDFRGTESPPHRMRPQVVPCRQHPPCDWVIKPGRICYKNIEPETQTHVDMWLDTVDRLMGSPKVRRITKRTSHDTLTCGKSIRVVDNRLERVKSLDGHCAQPRTEE